MTTVTDQAQKDRASAEKHRCPICHVVAITGSHALVNGHDCPMVGFTRFDDPWSLTIRNLKRGR